ncbi:hypothetical protein [Aquimarina litoralis]|uniref:hypothetical protein n=1 Tax=Aquimarina litoralis TaxID=584605 RepID=UPI001C5895CA|nr:hypothetical protein [Aquimarina litoralis]MBW1297359.1 hypothetical protein [Aquimarina litoralis]
MKKKLKSQYNSLEEIIKYLQTKTNYELSIKPDEWVTDGSLLLTPGKKCLVIKKSATAGAKINLISGSAIEIHPIPPSSVVNRITQKGLLAVIIYGLIIDSQRQVAEEVGKYLSEIQIL